MNCLHENSTSTSCGIISRRSLLTGSAGLLIAANLPATESSAQTPIDVHHHFAPPFYKASVLDWYQQIEAAGGAIANWSADAMLASLEAAGGVRAVLSISAPATTLSKGAEAIDMARRCNDYAADLARLRPRQISFFATVPMPDVKASIEEVDRAMALPGAAGVALLTNYDSHYLGDPRFDALLQHLHDRQLVTFVHPTSAPCCVGLTPYVGAPLIEFPNDTARAVGNLLWSGSLARYPEIKFIFSHGGGGVPMLTERLQLQGLNRPDANLVAPGGVDAMLRRLYVDTASATHAAGVAAARAQFGDDHVLFGTDAPWGTATRSLANLDRLNLDSGVRESIFHGNARKLIRPFQ